MRYFGGLRRRARAPRSPDSAPPEPLKNPIDELVVKLFKKRYIELYKSGEGWVEGQATPLRGVRPGRPSLGLARSRFIVEVDHRGKVYVPGLCITAQGFSSNPEGQARAIFAAILSDRCCDIRNEEYLT